MGGASAVGCGVFGLGGLLIGVALVVWLGSIALDGSSETLGRTPRGERATTTAAPIATTSATIALAPPADLADGTRVRVTGTDLPAGPIQLSACLTHAPAGGDRCDAATTTVASAGPDGSLSTSRTVRRVITVDDVRYDCAAVLGACSLRARPIGRPDDPGIATGLVFAAGLPPTDAEAPPTG